MSTVLKSILLSVALCMSMLAYATEDSVIKLSAQGEMKVAPNMASISLAVTNQAPTADVAVKENAKQMEQVVQSLKKALSDKDTLQTGRYQLTPVYYQDQNTRESKITGYRVTNQINIEYHDLNTLGQLLDTIVASGVNQLSGLQFGHTDASSLQSKALELAIQNGKANAQVIAGAAGVTLGSIQEISYFESRPGPVYREMAMSMDSSGGARTPVLPGELTISSMVNMTFLINEN